MFMLRPLYLPGEKAPGTNWTWGWVAPTASPDVVVAINIIVHARKSNATLVADSQSQLTEPLTKTTTNFIQDGWYHSLDPTRKRSQYEVWACKLLDVNCNFMKAPWPTWRDNTYIRGERSTPSNCLRYEIPQNIRYTLLLEDNISYYYGCLKRCPSSVIHVIKRRLHFSFIPCLTSYLYFRKH
jgi:hypothetical protein